MRTAHAAFCLDAPTAAAWGRICRLAWFVTLLTHGATSWAQTAGDNIEVQAEGRDGLIEVRARAVLRAPMALVWATLTDYEGLPGFIPGLASSRVVARKGAVVTVEQTGEARFLFLTVPIAVTLESTERPPHVVEVRRIAGSIRHLEGRYEATPQPNGKMLLRWNGAISPDAQLPPLIETTLVRLLIRDQFAGMVHEIERRAGTREAGPESRPGNR